MKLDKNVTIDDYHFPVNINLAKNLLGKILTHIEAMNLPESVKKANKDLLSQSFWSWWEMVKHSSLTSSHDCLAPIQELDGATRWLANDSSVKWKHN